MELQRLRKRFRRQLRRSQKQVEGLGTQVEENIEDLLFKRFDRLNQVRRFIAGWVFLLILLIGGVFIQNLALSNHYQTLQTVPGGMYKEGVIGSFTTANPLFATSNADLTVSRLIFSGLLKVDSNGQPVGDLAQSYEVDAKGLTYTIHLRPNLTWHDGQPLTSDDVVFTYQTIQNPDARSSLENSWRGISVTAPDKETVVFTLPSPLASFAYNLNNGIVPKHILSMIPVGDLRTSDFNTVRPIGAGPFAWRAIEVSGADRTTAQEQIALLPFQQYGRGAPKLDEFIVHVYASAVQLEKAFSSGQLTAAQGLNQVPKKHTGNLVAHDLPLKAATMVFFKTTPGGMLAEKPVRQALVQAADVSAIQSQLGYPTRLVREPILAGQIGYDKAYAQSAHNLPGAKKLLDEAGWKVGKGGIRYKDKKPLMFNLSAADTPEYRMVTERLRKQWKAAGVDVHVQLLPPNDLQNAITYHNYDALLYGISIGADPDVFVYWDSSQADIRSSNRLNFSEYKSAAADAALEAGRTRIDPTVRAFKYRGFLQAWQQDAPALGLYQPRMLYLTHGNVGGFSDQPISSPIDRFANVENWEIRQARVTN